MCGRQIMAAANSMRSAFAPNNNVMQVQCDGRRRIVCNAGIVVYFYITFADRVQHTIQAID